METLSLSLARSRHPEWTTLPALWMASSPSWAIRDDVALEVLLLENGHRDPAARAELRRLVDGASRRGLDIEVRTLEQQDADAEAGVFAVASDRLSERKSIALARTMLQHYLFLKAKPRQGAVVWILDDDILLEGLDYRADGSLGAVEVDYVPAIKRLKETGACVVLGEVVGDPPLPFLSCVRTQLVDLYHNLGQLAALEPKDRYPDRTDENRLSSAVPPRLLLRPIPRRDGPPRVTLLVRGEREGWHAGRAGLRRDGVAPARDAERHPGLQTSGADGPG